MEPAEPSVSVRTACPASRHRSILGSVQASHPGAGPQNPGASTTPGPPQDPAPRHQLLRPQPGAELRRAGGDEGPRLGACMGLAVLSRPGRRTRGRMQREVSRTQLWLQLGGEPQGFSPEGHFPKAAPGETLRGGGCGARRLAVPARRCEPRLAETSLAERAPALVCLLLGENGAGVGVSAAAAAAEHLPAEELLQTYLHAAEEA